MKDGLGVIREVERQIGALRTLGIRPTMVVMSNAMVTWLGEELKHMLVADSRGHPPSICGLPLQVYQGAAKTARVEGRRPDGGVETVEVSGEVSGE